MRMVTVPVVAVGRASLAFVGEMGAMLIFLLLGMRHMCSSTKQLQRVLRQVHVIGAGSFFLIALIGLFTGMVLGLQGYYTLTRYGSVGMLGSAVALTLIRELGPVLTAIMVTGRAGSAMAAEIGVMRISDQIDALEVMDINPYAYLVSPRITACLFVFPLLTAVFNVVGILGGYLTGVQLLGVNQGVYFYSIESSVVFADVAGTFIKSVFFALTVVTVCCYKGFFANLRQDGMGPAAVGNATTSAVVLSCVLLLLVDYVITSVLL